MNKLSEYINKFYTDLNGQDIKLGLDRVGNVKELANIQPNFPVVIVGGTNGKGSVCAFLETIYSKSGYSVGCYTSPHIFKFNERIKINLEQVDDKTILKSLDFIQSCKGSIELTYFEITTLAAMSIFIDKKIDIAILEVGLGGRHDAVNIFEPELSIITSIGLDHQDYLGDSIDEIAYQKLGICRPNKNTIINFDNAPELMIKELKKQKTLLSILNNDYFFSCDSRGYNYKSKLKSLNELPMPFLNGSNQLINLAGAIRAVTLLDKIMPVKPFAFNDGIKETKLEGRIQVISKRPYIMVDVAHNEDATKNLFNFFNKSKNDGKVYAVFSILKNKDIDQVIKPFIDIVDEWYISEINDSRTKKIEEIVCSIQKYNQKVTINKFDNLGLAYDEVCKKTNLNDNIVVYGSFFTVSEIMNGGK